MGILKNTTLFLDGMIVGGEDTSSDESTTETSSTEDTSTDDTANSGTSMISMIVIWAVVIGAMYLLMVRPQRKQEKQAQEMREALKLGDSVVTSGGLFGKVISLGTDSIMVEFGENRGVRVWVRKSDILGVREPVTTPPPVGGVVEDKKSNKKDKEEK